ESTARAEEAERAAQARLSNVRLERQRAEGKLKRRLQVLQDEWRSQRTASGAKSRQSHQAAERCGEIMGELAALRSQREGDEREGTSLRQQHEAAVGMLERASEALLSQARLLPQQASWGLREAEGPQEAARLQLEEAHERGAVLAAERAEAALAPLLEGGRAELKRDHFYVTSHSGNESFVKVDSADCKDIKRTASGKAFHRQLDVAGLRSGRAPAASGKVAAHRALRRGELISSAHVSIARPACSRRAILLNATLFATRHGWALIEIPMDGTATRLQAVSSEPLVECLTVLLLSPFVPYVGGTFWIDPPLHQVNSTAVDFETQLEITVAHWIGTLLGNVTSFSLPLTKRLLISLPLLVAPYWVFSQIVPQSADLIMITAAFSVLGKASSCRGAISFWLPIVNFLFTIRGDSLSLFVLLVRLTPTWQCLVCLFSLVLIYSNCMWVAGHFVLLADDLARPWWADGAEGADRAGLASQPKGVLTDAELTERDDEYVDDANLTEPRYQA
ncbi:unnamed protein product, partial [Prorocentrum cordatum]